MAKKVRKASKRGMKGAGAMAGGTRVLQKRLPLTTEQEECIRISMEQGIGETKAIEQCQISGGTRKGRKRDPRRKGSNEVDRKVAK